MEFSNSNPASSFEARFLPIGIDAHEHAGSRRQDENLVHVVGLQIMHTGLGARWCNKGAP